MDFFLVCINTLGMIFGVGSSTYAITFFHQSIADGVIDNTEKRFLRTVYSLLRAGMLFLFVSFAAQGSLIATGSESAILVGRDTLAVQATLLIAIFANALLMDARKIPMWLGPALAGASWYGIFFASVLDMYHFPYPMLMLWYLVLIVIFIILLRIIREYIITKRV